MKGPRQRSLDRPASTLVPAGLARMPAAPAARWGLLNLLRTLQEISVLSLPLR